jgi:hypothetical protein
MFTLLSILVAWLVADFYTGVFHWIEDRYMGEDMSIDFFHALSEDNALHHDKPTAMLLFTKWENMRTAAYFAWPVALVIAILGGPLWLVLSFVFVAFGSLIHRFSHTPRKKLPRWILFMQFIGLFISHTHHETHHRQDGKLVPKQEALIAYCGMTDWLNPSLDRVHFWARMEYLLSLFGILPVDRRPIVA